MNKNVLLPLAMTAGLVLGCSAEDKEMPKVQETVITTSELSSDTCQILGQIVTGLGDMGTPVLTRTADGEHDVVARDISVGELTDMLGNSIDGSEGVVPSTAANIEVLTSISTIGVLEDSLGDLQGELTDLSYSEMLGSPADAIIAQYTPVADQAREQVSTTFDNYCQ